MHVSDSSSGKAVYYTDRKLAPEELIYCYDLMCSRVKGAVTIIDYLARWENVGEVETARPDAMIFTCAVHQGAGFERAKKAFVATQQSESAAYLTREQEERL